MKAISISIAVSVVFLVAVLALDTYKTRASLEAQVVQQEEVLDVLLKLAPVDARELQYCQLALVKDALSCLSAEAKGQVSEEELENLSMRFFERSTPWVLLSEKPLGVVWNELMAYERQHLSSLKETLDATYTD